MSEVPQPEISVWLRHHFSSARMMTGDNTEQAIADYRAFESIIYQLKYTVDIQAALEFYRPVVKVLAGQNKVSMQSCIDMLQNTINMCGRDA